MTKPFYDKFNLLYEIEILLNIVTPHKTDYDMKYVFNIICIKLVLLCLLCLGAVPLISIIKLLGVDEIEKGGYASKFSS